MRTCYECGKTIPVDQAFCAYCGAPQPREVAVAEPETPAMPVPPVIITPLSMFGFGGGCGRMLLFLLGLFFCCGLLPMLNAGPIVLPIAPPPADDFAPTDGSPRLARVVTARAVAGDPEVRLEATSTFSIQDEAVYVVVQIESMPQGSTMFVRWSRAGQVIGVSDEFVAERARLRSSVDFALAADEATGLRPGDYSATVYVDGNPVETVEFTVIQNTGG